MRQIVLRRNLTKWKGKQNEVYDFIWNIFDKIIEYKFYRLLISESSSNYIRYSKSKNYDYSGKFIFLSICFKTKVAQMPLRNEG
jgi:hypothetical protein